ncbi:MAG: gliding-motility protein MglA [Deltaproteobacteria bacterium]|nr:gliding-motility protein MglA [Deltaproteobacteria bacterium]
MSFVNDSTKEINCKVVYFGPALCGKSTSLRSIYDQVKEKSKGEMISLATDDDRTLFFDFIPLYLGQIKNYTIRLHLYTVPGQVAYDAQRSLIAKGTDGVVFVADSQIPRMEANLASLVDLRRILKRELEDDEVVETFPLVIQYNKRDLPQAAPLNEMRDLLNTRRVPDFESVATSGDGVFDALKAISVQVLQAIR